MESERIATNGNVIAFPKHLKGKVPKDCMCPFCKIILESGVEDVLYAGRDEHVRPYFLQVFIESGERVGVAAFKKAVESLYRDFLKNNRE